MGKFLDYNEFADKYARNRQAIPFVLESLKKDISKTEYGSIILEIGCGTGDHIIALQRTMTFHEYTGFDISENMLAAAKLRCKNIEFKIANADEKFPYVDNSIDYAFMVNVVHHIEKPDVMFKESYRVLKPGGWLVIFTDSEEIIRKRSLTKFFPEVIEVELSRYPKIEDLNTAASEKGFIVEVSEEVRGSEDITEEFISRYNNKCSSALRIIPDEKHREGIKRLREAYEKGEKYHSYYLKLAYRKK